MFFTTDLRNWMTPKSELVCLWNGGAWFNRVHNRFSVVKNIYMYSSCAFFFRRWLKTSTWNDEKYVAFKCVIGIAKKFEIFVQWTSKTSHKKESYILIYGFHGQPCFSRPSFYIYGSTFDLLQQFRGSCKNGLLMKLVQGFLFLLYINYFT